MLSMYDIYEGHYYLPPSYNYAAWNRAGDLGIFQDDGFIEIFTVDNRDHWLT